MIRKPDDEWRSELRRDLPSAVWGSNMTVIELYMQNELLYEIACMLEELTEE